MRWVARLSEFVQWRASYVSQGRPGEHEQTTVVQETVWSPTSRATAGAETQPLFRRTQVRRLQDMTTAAPQLYGAVPQRGGGSESSASYTRDQEVRRQVEQAMEKQRGVSEENRALKAELERARREAAERREAVAASVLVIPLYGVEKVLGLAGTIKDGSKAIQQDFPDMCVSKGDMCFQYVRMIKYQREIQEDPETGVLRDREVSCSMHGLVLWELLLGSWGKFKRRAMRREMFVVLYLEAI